MRFCESKYLQAHSAISAAPYGRKLEPIMPRDDFNVIKRGRELNFIAKKLYSCFHHTAFLESYV